MDMGDKSFAVVAFLAPAEAGKKGRGEGECEVVGGMKMRLKRKKDFAYWTLGFSKISEKHPGRATNLS